MENVENEWIRNKWGSIPYNVLGMQPNTCEFLIWCAWAHANAIKCLSQPGLRKGKQERQKKMRRSNKIKNEIQLMY